MARLYNIGERVVCTDSDGASRLREGNIYVVRQPTDLGFISVEGISGGWFPYRFSSAEPLLSADIDTKADAKADVVIDERLNKLEKEMGLLIDCIKNWNGTGFGARQNFTEGLNWEALQLPSPKPKPKRRIVIRDQEEK